MKKIEAYIRHEALEAIHDALAERGLPSMTVSEEDELRGLDISEHGMFGYPERFIDVPGAESEDVPPIGPPASSGTATATNPATAS